MQARLGGVQLSGSVSMGTWGWLARHIGLWAYNTSSMRGREGGCDKARLGPPTATARIWAPGLLGSISMCLVSVRDSSSYGRR